MDDESAPQAMDETRDATTGEGFWRLDGNALAGALEEVFGRDATTATGVCAHCGRTGQLGAQLLYRAPGSHGAVLRCSACEGVLLVIVERPATHLVTMSGVVRLEI
jgi:hypothetical protein